MREGSVRPEAGAAWAGANIIARAVSWSLIMSTALAKTPSSLADGEAHKERCAGAFPLPTSNRHRPSIAGLGSDAA